MSKKLENTINRIMCNLPFKCPKIYLSRSEKLYLLLKDKKHDLFPKISKKSSEYKKRIMVYDYFLSKGENYKYIENLWTTKYNENNSEKRTYHDESMPMEYGDNKNIKTSTYNFKSGGGNFSSIRVPSKKHKNRYRNFMKLFPDYKDKNN